MNLDYVRLLVTKFDECFRFYRDIMGFKATWGTEGSNYASFDTGKTTLSMFKRHLMARDVGTADLPSEATAQDRVALIFGVEDVDATVRRIQEQGCHFITQPKNYADYGIRAAHLRDPDGNLIEIYATLQKSEWSEELRKNDEQLRN